MQYYGIVYMVTCIITGKIYIGMTTNFKNRKYRHLFNLKNETYSNNKFYNSLRKHGLENHEWKIIDWSASLEGLKYQEIWWIAKLDTFNNGLNGTIGGDSLPVLKGENHPHFGKRGKGTSMYGRRGKDSPLFGKPGGMKNKHHTKESKRKMSLAHYGKNNYWYGKKGPNIGKTFSKETKQKMALSRTLYWEKRKAML